MTVKSKKTKLRSEQFCDKVYSDPLLTQSATISSPY